MTQFDPISAAKMKIAHNERENDELRQFIITYRRLQADPAPIVDGDIPETDHEHAKQKTKAQAGTEIALEMYATTKKPVPTNDILSEMDKRGYGIAGEYKMSVLAGYLNAKGKVKAIRGVGWIPTE